MTAERLINRIVAKLIDDACLWDDKKQAELENYILLKKHALKYTKDYITLHNIELNEKQLKKLVIRVAKEYMRLGI